MPVAPFAEIKDDIDLSTPRFKSKAEAVAHGKDLAELHLLRDEIADLDGVLRRAKVRKNQVLDSIESRIANHAVSIFNSVQS